MANSEAMTSSTRSFAYSYRLVKKCFVKICETSKCHNFLIFQPIFIRFSLFCSENFTLSSEIMLNLFRSSPLSHSDACFRISFIGSQGEVIQLLQARICMGLDFPLKCPILNELLFQSSKMISFHESNG